MQQCTLRLSVQWRKPHRFLVSPHIHDTTYSFRISPCPLCSLLWISGLWHSTEIDSFVCSWFLQASSTSANNIRPDTPIFLTGEQLACFSGPFVPCFFLGISWQLDSAPSTLLSDAAASAKIPTEQAEKTLQRKLFRENSSEKTLQRKLFRENSSEKTLQRKLFRENSSEKTLQRRESSISYD